MKTVVTFGTFDLFHIGHLRMLVRASELGDRLVVGVSSDELNFAKKNKYPEFPNMKGWKSFTWLRVWMKFFSKRA